MLRYGPEAWAVGIRFVLCYLVLPVITVRRGLPLFERAALGFVGALSLMVFVVQTLSGLRLYEPMAIWGLVLAIYIITFTRRLPPGDSWVKVWLRFLDQMEEQTPSSRMATFWTAAVTRAKAGFFTALKHPELPVWLVGLGVLGWSAWLHLYTYLVNAYLGASDAYLHLAWTKYIEQNTIFIGGIYPSGYHAVISGLGYLTFLDRLLILRFLGPIGAVLLVLSVIYTGIKLKLRPAAVVLAAAVFGLSTASPLPADPWRQTHPLPQEFAAVFVLPGAVWAWGYLREGDRTSLVSTAAAVYLTTSIHTYALVYLALAVAIFAVCGWVMRVFPFKRVLTLAAASVLATLAGVAPMGIATLFGMEWHGSLNYVAGQVRTLEPVQGLQRFHTGNVFLDAGLALALVLVVAGVVSALRRKPGQGVLGISLGLILIFLFTQTHGQTGIPVLMDKPRSGLFFSLFLVVTLGLVLDRILVALRVRPLGELLVVLGLIAVFVTTWKPVTPGSVQQEYSEAVDSYLSISQEFTRANWTIISPVEQYSQTLGVGWHEDLATFLTKVNVSDVRRKKFQLYVPTTDVFVYVEKWPLRGKGPVQPDPDVYLNMDELGDSNIVLEKYYKNAENRRLLEARVWGIMEEYMRVHPDKITIYLETEKFRVYQIHHDPPKDQVTQVLGSSS